VFAYNEITVMCQNLSILWQQNKIKTVVYDDLGSKGKGVPAHLGTKWKSVVKYTTQPINRPTTNPGVH
jgi:hypothetical protein